jgi:DNA-binding MarR family transcriptional regulator
MDRRSLRPTDASELVALIGESFRQTRRSIEQVVRDYGITATQFGILRRIEDDPGMSRMEIARENFISSQAAQVALTTLEAKGLVARQPRSDSYRVVGAALTEQGEEVVRACRAATTPVADDFVAPLLPAELRTVIECLQRCVARVPEQSG